MGQVSPARVVVRPNQCIGYWGVGQSADLAAQLTRLSRAMADYGAVRQSDSCRDLGLPTCTWGLAVAGADPLPSPLPLAAPFWIYLSASGKASGPEDPDALPADAWVGVQDQTLILGREPFGRMPLYWMQQGTVLWFASRLQWLVPLLPSPQVNIAAVYGYSCFSYVPSPLTPVTGMMSVPAGVQQQWRRDPAGNRVDTSSRLLEWRTARDLNIDTRDVLTVPDLPRQIAQLQTLLQQAVQHQLTDVSADETVGVFLSGGLDSSAIAALLAQTGVKVRAYTLDFGTSGLSEIAYAEQVAAHLHIPLVKVDATPPRIRAALRSTAAALDLPFGDPVTVPLYLLGEAARQESRIIFNGEGGDQLFAGWTNKPLIAAGIYESAQPVEVPFIQQYLRTFHRFWGYEASIFQPTPASQIQSLDPTTWIQDALDSSACPTLLHQLRRANLMLKGAQNIHPRATSLGQSQGLGVRSPFCDLPLAQWTFQQGEEMFLQGSCEKYILKRAVEPWLPAEIVWRNKRGMGVPVTAWCWHDLWPDVGFWLHPKRLQEEGIWQRDIASQLLGGSLGTIQGRRIGECLWLLLMWQVWSHTLLGTTDHPTGLAHPFWLPAPLGRAYFRFRKGRESW